MSNNQNNRFNLAVLTCLGIGLLLSCLLAVHFYRSDTARIREEFSHQIEAYASLIDEQLGEDIAIMNSLKALFDASEEVTREEFRTFAKFLLSRYPSMRAIGWAPRVPENQREAYEEEIRNTGGEGFQITEREEQGLMVRARPRDEYVPVSFIEPLKGNEAALGFDLASNATRRDALHAARDSGKACATRRITLVQETAEEWAVLIFVPVYDGTPTDVDARRASLQGVVSGVFRLHDLLVAAGAHIPPDGSVDMDLLDVSDAGNPELLHETDLVDAELATEYTYEKCVREAGGRQWMLIATPTEAYIADQRTVTPYTCLFLGVLITGLLSFYLTGLFHEKQRVDLLVDTRTRELQNQTSALFRANADLEAEAIERKRLQRQFAEVTDREQRRLGQELHDSLGQQIAVAGMLARGAEKKVSDEDASATRLLGQLTESITTAQAQVRALSKGLLPVEINPGGLVAALTELTASVEGVNDVEMKLECDKNVVVEDNATATQLYRIAQEALRNALEHGNVSRITVCLRHDDRGLTLSIRDDGRGFDEASLKTAGAGLSIMRQRADLIGAICNIESQAEQGTSITCYLAEGSGPSGQGQTA